MVNLKNLKNLKEGFRNLTPKQLSDGRLAGYIGMIIGLILATHKTVVEGSLGLAIFLGFLAFFQTVGMIGEWQQNRNLKEMEAMQDE